MTAEVSTIDDILSVLDRIEAELAHFYGFTPRTRAANHLVDRKALVKALGSCVTELPEYGARAAVYVANDPDGDDLFLGIYLSDIIRGTLLRDDPFLRLSDVNLDAFCVAVEEVSHFHLIANRAARGRTVSKLELECQAEIDKLLVSALLLKKQVGDSHLLPLARRIYDQGSIIAPETERYWLATKYAAQFWFDTLRQGGDLSYEMRQSLRDSYFQTLDYKLKAA